MAPFSIFKETICQLFCLGGGRARTEQRCQTMEQQEANITAFLGKNSQAEPAKPSRSSHRIKRKPVSSRPTISSKDNAACRQPLPNNATDAGHQNAKPLPTTPYALSEITATPPAKTTATTTSRQVSNQPPLQPYPSRQFPTPKLSHSIMSSSTLKKTLDALHRMLSHTRYMVIGTAAMSIWGYTPFNPRYLPWQISIMCTIDDLPIIRSWAASTSYCVTFPGQSDMIGVVIDGKIRGVKIRTVSRETFEKLTRVSPTEMNKREEFTGWRENIMRTGAWVLGLGAMLDLLVGGWVAYSAKTDKSKEEEKKLERCGLWILWILRRLRDDSRLGREEDWDLDNSKVAKEEFWVPFTGVWPESVGLLMKLPLLKESTKENEFGQRKIWTGRRSLFVTSFASTSSGEEEESKGKAKEEHLSLTTLASSNCCTGSEELEELEEPLTNLYPDLARFHPDSFRIRAGLRDGSVSMREYVALVSQAEHGDKPNRSDTM